MKKLKLLLILSALSILAVNKAQATIINVPEDHTTIQGGINAAVDGDTVLVQVGTYVENINFNGKNIIVGSLFLTTQDTAFISQTIIDGNQNGSVVTFISGEELSSKITGFTITNGYVDLSVSNSGGAGIRCLNSSPTIENSIIKENYCYWYTYGGGIYCENSNSHILNNAICYNDGAAWGGGICICGDSEVLIKGNIIHDNVTESGYGEDHGGGIYCWGNECYCDIENTTIYNNIVDYGTGGGICCYNISNLSLKNVTISNNSAPQGGGICCQNSSSPSLINCILWNNSPQEVFFINYYSPNTITIAYSDIKGGLEAIVTNNNGTVNWLEGNIDADPLFANPTNGNYHLTWTNYPIPDETKSPCIDSGDPDFPVDPDGSLTDMGALTFVPVVVPEQSILLEAGWNGLSSYLIPNALNPDLLFDRPGILQSCADDP